MAPRSVATTFTAWGELDVESSDITAEIRMAVLGEWVPPQLADVLALQRAEEPETHAVLAGWTDPGRGAELPDDGLVLVQMSSGVPYTFYIRKADYIATHRNTYECWWPLPGEAQ